MQEKKYPLMGILSATVTGNEKTLTMKGLCILKLRGKKEIIDTEHLSIDVPVKKNAGKISFHSRYGKHVGKGFRLNRFVLTFDIEEALNYDIQNKIELVYKGKYKGRILYRTTDLKKGKNRRSQVFIREGSIIYFRQSSKNSLYLTTREANIYDYPEGEERIEKAYRKAKKSRKNLIMMYEKNCSRYQESASILYEKLIDAGYDNVYYVVNSDNKEIRNLEEKYKKNLIAKDSDEHLELFFASNTFISTETTDHALQLRSTNKKVIEKQNHKDLKYIFLQHGVMYMVSLNSDKRVGFREKKHKFQRTVVSSEAEARHFIELAGMPREKLYITGLAKFDTSYQHEDADKIIIMPTWRRWEMNRAKEDLQGTGYYKMIKKMYDAVPENLKEKVIILPHPLMADEFAGEEAFGKHLVLGESYDKILRSCDLLITDYSSVSYDVFHRGANIIFYWAEKDECMEKYGEGTYLMLNNENVFGDICMDEEEIRKAIQANYKQKQPQKYVDRYNKIVEFRDGHNTDRIIDCLIKDGIIEEKDIGNKDTE
ncbi:MAG TPA: hypothetical protein GX736_02910 [Mogibacterium sp.]|nr:hypothetical protein [Mogibacterium sp.]